MTHFNQASLKASYDAQHLLIKREQLLFKMRIVQLLASIALLASIVLICTGQLPILAGLLFLLT